MIIFRYLAVPNQVPKIKFVIDGKSSNFIVNSINIFVVWGVSFIIFTLVIYVIHISTK